MNTKPLRYLFGAASLAAFLTAGRVQAQPFGQWDFNSSNLTATVGTDLTFADGSGGATDLGTAFGTNRAFGIPRTWICSVSVAGGASSRPWIE